MHFPLAQLWPPTSLRRPGSSLRSRLIFWAWFLFLVSIYSATRSYRYSDSALAWRTVGFFFSKSVNKSVKHAVRVLHARSARASHAQTFCLTLDSSCVLEYAKIRTVLQSSSASVQLTRKKYRQFRVPRALRTWLLPKHIPCALCTGMQLSFSRKV